MKELEGAGYPLEPCYCENMVFLPLEDRALAECQSSLPYHALDNREHLEEYIYNICKLPSLKFFFSETGSHRINQVDYQLGILLTLFLKCQNHRYRPLYTTLASSVLLVVTLAA